MNEERSVLGEAEGRYRELVKLIPAIVCELAPDGTTLFVNDAVTAITGYRPDELQGENWWDSLYPGERPDRVGVHVSSRFGDVTNQETTLTAKDGSLRTLVWTSFNEHSPDGALKSVVGFGIDYTDRKQAEGLFRTLVGSTPLGSYIVQGGRFRFVSEQLQRYTGYGEGELLGTDPMALVVPEDRGMVRENAIEMIKGRRTAPYEYRIVYKGGEVRWIMETVASIEFQGRRATLGNFMDITDRKRAETALEQSEQRFRLLFEKSPMGIAIVRHFTLLYANPTCQKMFGHDGPPEGRGGSLLDYFVSPERELIAERIRAQEQGGRVSSEYESVGQKKDGSQFPIHVVVAHIGLPDGPAVVAFITDITERKQSEETIRQLAYRDPLTGLPNRSLFGDRLGLALAHARRNQQKLAVSMVDLDQFKQINDTLGHDVGDCLLRAIAERLTGLLRCSDTVARMGGDEFMLLLPGLAEPEQASEVVERILNAVCQPFGLDGRQLSITASVGIAVYPEDGEDAETLMKNADVAMYRTKEQGRNGYRRYEPVMRTGELG